MATKVGISEWLYPVSPPSLGKFTLFLLKICFFSGGNREDCQPQYTAPLATLICPVMLMWPKQTNQSLSLKCSGGRAIMSPLPTMRMPIEK